MFRHAAKITTAGIGDFDRSLFPFLSRVAAVAIRHAAEQTTHRQEPEPSSYEAEAKAIRARFGAAIDAARRLNKPRHEIEAIIRGFREQQAAELAAVRRRRREARPPKPEPKR